MINRIDALIEQLKSVCDEFDYIGEANSNWHVMCWALARRNKVEHGISGLREMQEYLSQLGEWRLEQLREAYRDTCEDWEVM